MEIKDKTPILNSQTPCNARERLASMYYFHPAKEILYQIQGDEQVQLSDTLDKIGIRRSSDLVEEDGGGGKKAGTEAEVPSMSQPS
jgi:hypothetical protein